MMRGTVIGEVWATRHAPGVAGRKLLLVAAEASDTVVVGIDTLGARVGDRVLLTWGSGARIVLRPGEENRGVLADAAVCQVIDGASDPAGREG